MNESGSRKTSKHEDGADLISKLPDPILHLFLLRVPATEEIIRTSILSRRWRYVWTSIPSLDMDLKCPGQYARDYPLDKSKTSQFKEFVDWVLLNRSVDLDRFRLSCSNYYSMSTVESWIDATVTRNVKQLVLRFCPNDKSEKIVMPNCLVNCASLEVFKLTSRDRGLILPEVMGFPALRVLYLGYLELKDYSLEDLLESCPMLEDLTLDELTLDEIDLCISSPKLKMLRFNTLCTICLTISCPSLKFLVVTGNIAVDIVCERLDSLKEAIFGINPSHICELFPGISHLESLDSELEFLYESLDGVRGPALPNLKTLELSATEFFFTRKYLNKILKHCPQLESLTLNVDNRLLCDKWGDGQTYKAKSTSKLTEDVKWIGSYKIKGKKLKLDITWWESNWLCIVATWGKKPTNSDWMRIGYLST